MDKKKIELIITGILIVIFIIVLANSFRPRRPKKVVKPVAEVKIKELPPLPVKTEEYSSYNTATSAQLTAQKKRAELDWGIDPFYHPVKKDVSSSLRLVLKGVSIGKGRKNYAFINDEIVAEGEKISGYEVVKVEKNKVLLKRGKEEFYLVLPEEEKK